MSLNRALEGVRVLDFSQVGAGPACGMLLGDMGADVVKIEAPGGDIGRKLGPPWQQGESVVSMSFNRNKRSIVLDLKKPDGGRARRGALAAAADVVVESFRPGVMEKLGLGYARLVGGSSAPRVLLGLGLRPERPVARQARRRRHHPGGVGPHEPDRRGRRAADEGADAGRRHDHRLSRHHRGARRAARARAYAAAASTSTSASTTAR